jgi:hypothetical protein
MPANHFQLEGENLHITYSPFVEAGKPTFVYQDKNQTLHFTGQEIQSIGTEAGTLVTVVIRKTIDAGSTTFSVLIPRVQVAMNGSAPVHTVGITTVHKFSVVPAMMRGQLDEYTTTPLHGTASHVLF